VANLQLSGFVIGKFNHIAMVISKPDEIPNGNSNHQTQGGINGVGAPVSGEPEI
jgi:hypothetical protein